ncbi:TIGR01459 family HAD-type hydrolase [Amaricoccus solimangrovi]|uniref:TIGR01459 family HAD-type hydrolase n=1 Tax=Amaricoccus solimangrovi TaxID=2589815 RepID=A0A501WJQ2_9RHOB|nr:TIGR01459 family HAD-type hydrolase [Amaricoccus solimangrovi]TPE47367.1 TIGR01459 family HAD-type hydrolase [Amaricoccus solimangrovi]
MTQIIQSLDDIAGRYQVLYCDLWGCLHDGVTVFPAAAAALAKFRAGGGAVVLLTNSPRPAAQVAAQIRALGAPDGSYDLIVSSGDAAQHALAIGMVGRRVYHIGPARDLSFFADAKGVPFDVERVPLEEAEGIVCTGLFDDRTETPADYRATLLYGKTKGMKLLCANPDIMVDVGDQRIYCAGAIAQAYTEMGGESFYFGKPYPPIYALARRRLAEIGADDIPPEGILCLGDGLATDIAGAMGEDLDSLFIAGGLLAEETGTSPAGGPDPEKLEAVLRAAKLSPPLAMAYLR